MVPLLAILLLFWVALNASLSWQVLSVGITVSLLIGWLFRRGLSPLTELRATPASYRAGLGFVWHFLRELVRSNLNLARVVLSPDLPVNPGIVKVRTRLQSPMGRLLLANAITLTPGTLTVELQDEWLYVHWVQVESADIDAATARIVAGFERYLEVMYG
ncbi:Na+/H+ antiporter subunit E [Thiohalocapsa marina]|nr:Na+/H+ antiporter subunit E [Thiohalocapsa marina]